jgi:hypothetical protein
LDDSCVLHELRGAPDVTFRIFFSVSVFTLIERKNRNTDKLMIFLDRHSTLVRAGLRHSLDIVVLIRHEEQRLRR